MDKRTEFTSRMKQAMKDGNQIALSTIRLIMAALKDRDISARGGGKADGIDEAEILSMLQSMIKQRHESLKTYRDAGREDLAAREEQEIKIIEEFLPKQLDDSAVQDIVVKTIAASGASSVKDMGKVMAEIKANYAGQFDMAKASSMVKDKLMAG
jgi:uncharacterized protein YqeY